MRIRTISFPFAPVERIPSRQGRNASERFVYFFISLEKLYLSGGDF